MSEIIRCLAEECQRLNEENEALRAEAMELAKIAGNESKKADGLKSEIERLRVAELEEGISEALKSPFGYQGGIVKGLLTSESQSWLLRKQAEAVDTATEVFLDQFPEFNGAPESSAFSSYTQRLRQRADEIERGGA